MSRPAPGPWSYYSGIEAIRDCNGNVIARMEPDSGPLAAAAPDLRDRLLTLTRKVEQIAGESASEGRYGSLWAEVRDEINAANALLAELETR
ncbi:MAG: hypothetical protein LC687_08355 [Actinobacteria bacterium]|nr:hypothetical protein [Actinomycetota bacterium]